MKTVLLVDSVLTSLTTSKELLLNKLSPSAGSSSVIFLQLKSEKEMGGNYKIFNITIITQWPFISHGLGTLVEAGVLKITQAFIFFCSLKGGLVFTLTSQKGSLCARCGYFSSFFSCMRVVCPTDTGEGFYRSLCFWVVFGGGQVLQSQVFTMATESLRQLSLMWFSFCWERKSVTSPQITVSILLSDN